MSSDGLLESLLRVTPANKVPVRFVDHYEVTLVDGKITSCSNADFEWLQENGMVVSAKAQINGVKFYSELDETLLDIQSKVMALGILRHISSKPKGE